MLILQSNFFRKTETKNVYLSTKLHIVILTSILIGYRSFYDLGGAMKDKLFGILQRVGRSFMLPIALLPVAGLFLGIGGSFTNETMLKTYGLLDYIGPGTFFYNILTVLKAAGAIVFENLPILFAIGVAIGMAKQEKEVAALAGAIAFFVMHSSIGAMVSLHGGPEALLAGSTASVVGITSLQMGVFGGILVGIGVAYLHNRFYKINLPAVLSFFGGTRFVPIISSIVYLVVGIIMFYLWPFVQNGIYAVGGFVMESGYGGTLLYGIMERALIPFGLHHVFYLPFWQTAVGGTATVDGVLVEGAQNIFFAELASHNISHFSVSATRFMSGKFPLMIFGLPGAAYAMYRAASPEKRKVAGGLLLSAALTSVLTGITEPIEFTFLFVAPILYIIHCFFAGCAYMLMHIFGVGVGMTFSGGFIDMFLFGILQGNSKTSWINIVIVGIGYFALYYFLFSFMIRKFNYKTPGREDTNDDVKLYRRADVEAAKAKKSEGNSDDVTSSLIEQGLGGQSNIRDIDCCATRLRVTVNDGSLVKEDILKSSGAAGVIKKGNGVQVIYGPRVTVIKSNLDDYLRRDRSEDAIIPNNATNNHSNKSQKKNNSINNTAIPFTNDQVKKVYSPIKGKIMPLSEVNDGVFSEEMLGKGVAIEPVNNEIVSPVNGNVTMVYDTKHAIGITSDEGVEILIHIGIDTVKLGGKHFDIKVAAGEYVKAGDLLAIVDFEGIKNEGYRIVTPIIITNTDKYQTIQTIANNEVKHRDALIEIK